MNDQEKIRQLMEEIENLAENVSEAEKALDAAEEELKAELARRAGQRQEDPDYGADWIIIF